MRLLRTLLCTMLLGTFAAPAAAEPITIDFTGVLTDVINMDQLMPDLAIGTTFSGEAIYTSLGEPDRYSATVTMMMSSNLVDSTAHLLFNLDLYMEGSVHYTTPDGNNHLANTLGLDWVNDTMSFSIAHSVFGLGIARGTLTSVQTVPEPGTIALMLTALCGLATALMTRQFRIS